MFILNEVSCGGITIDSVVPAITSTVITIIKWAVPVMIIFFGVLDMAKAVIAQEEKEMKEAQKMLIKRIIYGVVVFLVIALVQAIFGIVDKSSSDGTKSTSCISCFINNQCDK